MSAYFTEETPIARKDAWRLALVTLRALLVAASQSVVEERSRPLRKDSFARCRQDEEDDCKDTCKDGADNHSSSGTTASPRTSSIAPTASSENDSDGSSVHVREWQTVGGRVMNALRDEALCEDEGTIGTTATPRSSLSSDLFGASDNVSDDASPDVRQWHSIGGRLMNALRDETLCEDEKNWSAVNGRIANAFRRSEASSDPEDEDEFGEVGWKSVGNRLANAFRGCSAGDTVDGLPAEVGGDEGVMGALLLLGLSHGIDGLDLREWYAVGTRLAMSCNNYAVWADGKVDPAAWHLLCTTAFAGRMDGSGIGMRHELDAMCRGYTTMCCGFDACGKGWGCDTPCTKEVDIAEVVAWQKTGSRLAAVCRNVTDGSSDEIAFSAVNA